jgi:TonB family protein
MPRRVTAAMAALLLGVCVGPAVAVAQEARRDEPPPPPAPTGVVTKAPVLLQAVAPEYPPAALAAGKQAQVPVRISIDADGVVTKVEVITPQGDGFDAAAVAAAEQYVFEPAEIDGKPGPITVETTIHFVIEQVEEPDPPPVDPDGGKGGGGGGGGAVDPAAEGPPSHGGDIRTPVSIEGEVVERGTRSKLGGVIVSVAELGLDAVTDENGRFWFHGVPEGPYTILAVADKFDRLERAVHLGKRETIEVRLWLRPRGGSRYETVVEGEREVLEVTKRTLQRQQLTSVPGTFGDPLRVIQTLPGLARTPFGLGFLVIRGSNPDDSAVYIDGHRVPQLFHFLGGPSILNAEFLDSIDLYPSGYPARFGRSHGGVVAVETRATRSDGIHGSADVDLLDAGGYVRAPLGKNRSFGIAGRRSYIDQLLPYVLPEPSPGSTRVVVPVYWDAMLRFDWDLKKEGKLGVFAIRSSDELDVLQADEDEEESLDLNTAVKFFRLIGKYQRPLAGDFTLTLSPAWGRDSVSFAAGQQGAASAFTEAAIVQDTIGYRMRLKGPLAKTLLLDAGLDIESRVTRYDALVPDDSNIEEGDDIDIDPTRLLRSVEQMSMGVHADLAADVTPKLRLLPGLRMDAHVISGQAWIDVDARLTGRYQTTPTVVTKGYVGVFHQPPQPESVDARFGNPEVRSERGVHVGAGAEVKPNKLWYIDGEVYYIHRDQLVVFSGAAEVEGETADAENFVNTGSGQTWGFEAMVRREISEKVYGWLSYTLGKSWRRTRDTSRATPTAFDQPHNLNAVVSWKPGGGWELGGRLRLSSGRPDTPYIGATYDGDSGGYRPVSGGFRTVRRELFHQVDLRVEKTWLFELWSMGLYLDVQNVFNVGNVEAIEWDYRYRESAPVTGVPILPTIGIRGQW